jgi:Mrp family chromosome partitioning ATPase/capsular polysaccharide biosynthesis protein
MRQRNIAARGPFDEPTPQEADWIGDAAESHGLSFYLDLLRARLWLVILIVAITLGTAAFYLVQADKVYEAHADMLVTPIAGSNEDLLGLGLPFESGDPTRDSETIARLITTTPVAERARTALGTSESASQLLSDVTAEPVAGSSIVSISAKANDPNRASLLANAFANGAIDVRTDRLRNVLDTVIPQLRRQLADVPLSDVGTRDELGGKLRTLQGLRLLQDPTLHLEAEATAPKHPVSPRPALTIAASLLGAFVLAFGIILGAHFINPRIEREEDLRRYRIPVIGRIPREGWRRRRGPLFRRTHAEAWHVHDRPPIRPNELSHPTADAFHRLASSLAARTGERERAIFVTSPGPNDGKTTTSLNLVAALAAFNQRVVVVDGDSRRPAIAKTLGVAPEHGIDDVVSGRVSVSDALVEADGLFGRVQVLTYEADEPAPIPVSSEAADSLTREVLQRGAWLVADGPALSYGPDSLPLAKRVASVLIVVRLRWTRARDLADLAELLSQQGIVPRGFIVVGGKPRAVYG